MTSRKNLVAVDSDAVVSQAEPDESELATESAAQAEDALTEVVVEDEEPEQEPPRLGWIAPTLGVLVVVGWSGFFGWIHRQEALAGAPPARWAEWIVDWSVPVLLVVALWLLAMRKDR